LFITNTLQQEIAVYVFKIIVLTRFLFQCVEVQDTRGQFMLFAYTIKTKTANLSEKDLPFWKNDIPNNLGHQKPVIYSRYREFCLGNRTQFR